MSDEKKTSEQEDGDWQAGVSDQFPALFNGEVERLILMINELVMRENVSVDHLIVRIEIEARKITEGRMPNRAMIKCPAQGCVDGKVKGLTPYFDRRCKVCRGLGMMWAEVMRV